MFSSSVLDHGVIIPIRQLGQFPLSGCFDGPAPGLEEAGQVHPHSLRESLSIQVHLCVIVIRKVSHVVVRSKNLLKGIPAKLFLELQRR